MPHFKKIRLLLILVLATGVACVASTDDFFSASAGADEKGKPNSPAEYWLGVVCHPLTKTEKGKKHGPSHGLTVEKVIPGSPAAQAEVHVGDVLLMFADQGLKKVDDL